MLRLGWGFDNMQFQKSELTEMGRYIILAKKEEESLRGWGVNVILFVEIGFSQGQAKQNNLYILVQMHGYTSIHTLAPSPPIL